MAFDGSVFVQRSINEAQETLLLTAALVILIIFLFLAYSARDDHPGARDPRVDHRDLRDPRRARLLDQHAHAARADPRHRHRGGRRDHRAGERVPASGRAAKGSRDGRDRRHQGDHDGGDRHDHRAARGVLTAALPHRRDRTTLQRVRRRGRRLGPRVGHCRADVDADALGEDPARLRPRVTLPSRRWNRAQWRDRALRAHPRARAALVRCS